MNVYISKIFILGKYSELREVPLNRGVNIITGNSKTGKSALIEIVDYCLCSKSSSIPKGEISDFGEMFGIVLEFPNKKIIVGRKNILNGGLTKMYVCIEGKGEVSISLDYFSKQTLLLRKQAQTELERHLGLSVADISKSDDVENWQRRKVGLREMTPFFFQHQNLIANKHALFYGFNDHFKRQATIDSFPIFAGLVSDEYFSLSREIESKNKELRKLLQLKKKQEERESHLDEKLKPYFRNYFDLIDLEFDEDLTISDLLRLGVNLPTLKVSKIDTSKILQRYNLLKLERDKLDTEIAILGKNLIEIDQTETYATGFRMMLAGLDEKSKLSVPESTKYSCPVCGQEHIELSQDALKIKNAKENLKKELEGLANYSVSFQKEKDLIKSKISDLNSQLKIVLTSMAEIERINKEVEQEKGLLNQVAYAKAQIETRVEFFEQNNSTIYEDDIAHLKAEIEELRQKIGQYNLDEELRDVEEFLKKAMNNFGKKLDFEEELKPVDFSFDLKDFSFSHYNKNNREKVSLGEMGSGANWITCHLAVLTSFLFYFSKNRDSKIPTFLFLDQPSQVYFPSDFDLEVGSDNDIEQVEKIYIAIIDRIYGIKKVFGYAPQVIITDHADRLDLGSHNFEDFVVRRWKPGYDIALI